jgi:hypothetical protein
MVVAGVCAARVGGWCRLSGLVYGNGAGGYGDELEEHLSSMCNFKEHLEEDDAGAVCGEGVVCLNIMLLVVDCGLKVGKREGVAGTSEG